MVDSRNAREVSGNVRENAPKALAALVFAAPDPDFGKFLNPHESHESHEESPISAAGRRFRPILMRTRFRRGGSRSRGSRGIAPEPCTAALSGNARESDLLGDQMKEPRCHAAASGPFHPVRRRWGRFLRRPDTGGTKSSSARVLESPFQRGRCRNSRCQFGIPALQARMAYCTGRHATEGTYKY
jgi:hypothetical protein